MGCSLGSNSFMDRVGETSNDCVKLGEYILAAAKISSKYHQREIVESLVTINQTTPSTGAAAREELVSLISYVHTHCNTNEQRQFFRAHITKTTNGSDPKHADCIAIEVTDALKVEIKTGFHGSIDSVSKLHDLPFVVRKHSVKFDSRGGPRKDKRCLVIPRTYFSEDQIHFIDGANGKGHPIEHEAPSNEQQFSNEFDGESAVSQVEVALEEDFRDGVAVQLSEVEAWVKCFQCNQLWHKGCGGVPIRRVTRKAAEAVWSCKECRR
ncbi:hypothetical protein BV898_18911 [Hypsibius exemplaris]|uniref:Uncharacterized protein n=1 Tax=Hypsibius exemplaris TaxID=2072580 RepID=A0A9X6NKR7_HYPEX|nr:hypothetical protein BV898_18911 [Hypsibius exemplaris]